MWRGGTPPGLLRPPLFLSGPDPDLLRLQRGPPQNVAAAALAERTDQRLLRLRARHLDEVGDAGATAAGRRRLVLADTHGLKSSSMCSRWQPGQETGPPKMSMDPSLRVTMARLVSLRLPGPKRVRRVLPLRFRV